MLHLRCECCWLPKPVKQFPRGSVDLDEPICTACIQAAAADEDLVDDEEQEDT